MNKIKEYCLYEIETTTSEEVLDVVNKILSIIMEEENLDNDVPSNYEGVYYDK